MVELARGERSAVARGEVIGLVGENGAGKSTLDEGAGRGNVAPTSGTIRDRRRQHAAAMTVTGGARPRASPSCTRNSTCSTISTSPPTSSSAASRCGRAAATPRPPQTLCRAPSPARAARSPTSAGRRRSRTCRSRQRQLPGNRQGAVAGRPPRHHGRADLEPDAVRDRAADSAIIADLKANGVSVIFISHRLNEVERLRRPGDWCCATASMVGHLAAGRIDARPR